MIIVLVADKACTHSPSLCNSCMYSNLLSTLVFSAIYHCIIRTACQFVRVRASDLIALVSGSADQPCASYCDRSRAAALSSGSFDPVMPPLPQVHPALITLQYTCLRCSILILWAVT